MLLRYLLVLLCATLFFASSTAQKNDELPRFQQHIVRDNETAASIVANFNIKLRYFLMLNNFPDNVVLKPGQKVLIRQLKDGETAEKEGAYYASKPADVSTKETVEEKKTEGVKKEAPVSSVKETKQPVYAPQSDKNDQLTGPDGTKYSLTSGAFHVVQKGQTFYRIALIYHLTIDELKAINNMTTTDIKVGQELKVSK